MILLTTAVIKLLGILEPKALLTYSFALKVLEKINYKFLLEKFMSNYEKRKEKQER